VRTDNLIYYGDAESKKLRITYHLTLNCNYKCDYCGIRDNSIKTDYDITNKFLNFIEDIDNNIELDILITGGEPTIYPYFIPFMKNLSSVLKFKKASLCLLTNATANLHTYKTLAHIMNDIDFNMYVSYHKKFINFNKFIYKCKQLRDLNIPIELAFMIESKECISEYNKMKDIFKDDSDFLLVYKTVRDNLYESTKIDPDIKDDVELRTDFIKSVYFKNDKYILKHKRIYNRNFKGFICLAYTRSLLIEVDGSINPCFSIRNRNYNLDYSYKDIINKTDKILCTSKHCAYEHSTPKFFWSHLDLLTNKEKCIKVFNFIPGWINESS